MKQISVKTLFASPELYGGEEVMLSGWVRTVRDSKTFAFIELNDGSTIKTLQIVMDENTAGFDDARRYNVGSAIHARGNVVMTPEAKQPLELKATEIILEGASTPDYPLQKKRHSMEFLRTIAHLRPRTNTFGAVFRVRSEAAFALHEFFHERGFVYAHTPIITASDGEGAGEMFRVTTLEPGETDFAEDFFGKFTGLTVTGQLEAETFAQAFAKTYTFGPTFRAERSNTPRHAAEFWMIEPEIAFADLADVMELAEAMVKHVIVRVLERCPDEITFLNSFVDTGLVERLQHVSGSGFARMTYTDAITELEKVKDTFEFPVFWGCDIQTEHERYLTEKVVGRPVFVTDYPKGIKAFYMRQNEDGKTVAACDLLVAGIGELIGGSQREEREDVLRARIEELGMPIENYDWYIELRKYGTTKHGGFGIGFERLVMYLTGIANIRDVLPFPRTTGSADF